MGIDFKHTTSVADYELWALAHREKEPSKTSRFITMSAGFHVIALVLVGMMATPLVEDLKTETVTIEIEDINPLPTYSSKGINTPATQGSAAPAAPVIAEKISAEDIVVPVAAPVAALPEKELPTKALPAKAPAAKAAAPARTAVAAKSNFQAVPATIDDIEAPELDKGDFAEKPVAASDLSDDLNKDFSKIDSQHADDLENEKRSMDTMAAALASEQDENLNGLAEQNQEDEARLNQAQDDLRKKNAAAVASALAAENAAAEAAAKERASRLAAERQAAAAAKANAEALAAKSAGHGSGEGMGNNGANQKGTALAGTPTGIRSLDQLRQMPGNPRPQYDRDERLRGDQGEIAFVAYISKEGYPTQFKLKKSTGFRNLDAKTLSALKKWRFYPGQEGWVELPFRWDLKGGVQEDGGMLRRAVSSN